MSPVPSYYFFTKVYEVLHTGIFGIHIYLHRGILGPVDDCCHLRRHVKEAVSKELAFMHGLEVR